MRALSHKAKQYLLITLKVFILGITFGYIYLKLTSTDAQTWEAFTGEIHSDKSNLIYDLLLFVLLAIANWVFEIFKWKTVVSHLKSISFVTAFKQCLASHTVSLATPNRVGEYGAKALYYEAVQRKQVLVINFFSSSSQMSATLGFGLSGLIIVSQRYELGFSSFNLVLVFIAILLLGIVAYLFKEQQLLVKGLSIANIFRYLNEVKGTIKLKVVVFSILRFLIFSFLFYRMLHFFGGELSATEAFPLIFTMYLLVSILPSIIIFDVVIRGGVAVWLFSLAGIPELLVLCTVLGMWLLNVVLPAVWGSLYLVSFQPQTK